MGCSCFKNGLIASVTHGVWLVSLDFENCKLSKLIDQK